jgi:hypothetical protein
MRNTRHHLVALKVQGDLFLAAGRPTFRETRLREVFPVGRSDRGALIGCRASNALFVVMQ